MLIAHRGFKTQLSENTLKDFEKALAKTVGVEFDIRLTKDKKVIIFHDKNFKRIAGQNILVSALTYDEILELNYFKNNISKNPPLLVEDFGKTLAKEFKVINVEIKEDYYSNEDFEVIHKSLKDLKTITTAEIIVSSFGKAELNFISKLENEFSKGFLVKKIKNINTNILDDFDYLHMDFKLILNKKISRLLRIINKKINVWTVNSQQSVEKIKQASCAFLVKHYISDNEKLIV